MELHDYDTVSRRSFLGTALTGSAAVALTRPAYPAEVVPKTPRVCVFSKHLQFLDYQTLAKTCREIGADGIDLTVRPKGHVEPDRVETDLPGAVEAIRAEGLEAAMITTNLKSGNDPTAERILKTASALGIGFFRIGGHQYVEQMSPAAQLPAIVEDLRSLVGLCAQYKMAAGYHNHSGGRNFAAMMWDLHEALHAVDSPWMGANFDVGHARVEGGLAGWALGAELLGPSVKMAAVKDFVWDGAKEKWVPLGEGIVPLKESFRKLRTAGFSGPVSIHVEYKVSSDEAMIQEMRRAIPVLRQALNDAGYV